MVKRSRVKIAKQLLKIFPKIWWNLKTKKLSETIAQSRVSNMSNFYMIMPSPNVCNCYIFLMQNEKVTVLQHPLFTICCPLWFLPFSEIENLPRWTQILVQTCCTSIAVYLTSISKSAYRDAFRKWIHRLKPYIPSHPSQITYILNTSIQASKKNMYKLKMIDIHIIKI